jgi:hypothetical protein
MEKSARQIIEGVFQAVMDKNLEAVVEPFAEDGVFYDPHYPRPRMMGLAQIREGIAWGLSSLEKPGFTIRNFWFDGEKGAVELDTHHVIRGNMRADFDQVFVFEMRDGRLKWLQSYVPYGPHGIAGFITGMTRLAWKLQGRV